MRQWQTITIGLVGALILGGVGIFVIQQMRGGGEEESTTNPTDPFGGGDDRTLEGTDRTNPFGSGAVSSSTGTLVIESDFPTIARLYQPAAGATIVEMLDNSGTPFEQVRFADRATGHLYSYNLGRSGGAVKITNTTIPRLFKATFSQSSSTAFQYLGSDRSSVETFLGTLATPPIAGSASPEEEAPYFTMSGRFLPSGIASVVYSPQADQIAYLTTASGGSGSSIIVASLDGTNPKEIATVPFKDVTLSWPTKSMLLVNTNATTYGAGVVYGIDPATPGQKKIYLSGVTGLSVLGSPDGKWLLYSSYSAGITSLNALALESGITTRLPIETLPEKCAWGNAVPGIVYCAVPGELPPEEYADRWYRGEVGGWDLIWKMNVETLEGDIIASKNDDEEFNVDAIDLRVGPRDGFLTFINRADDTLYAAMLPTLGTIAEP